MTTPTDTPPLVHVVDDEASVRSALAFLLQSHGIDAATYEDGAQFLEHVRTQHPRGVILLDVRMEPLSGLQVHDELLAMGVKLPVLFLSGHGDIPMAVEALHKGATDFIEKPFNADDLVRRLQRALDQERQWHEAQSSLTDEQRRIAALTEREQQVMHRVAQGKLNKVIADELCVSVRTVEVHRSRVFAKLGVRSSAELATLLARNTTDKP